MFQSINTFIIFFKIIILLDDETDHVHQVVRGQTLVFLESSLGALSPP